MNKKKGFTLIEVVVAVIIVGVLAGIAATSYTLQRRRSEYNGMTATVMSIVGAVKNRYYVTNNILTTANTLATNNGYQLAIRDGNFFNYRVAAAVPFFNVLVQYGPRAVLGDMTVTASYTFNGNGTQTACAGADCL